MMTTSPSRGIALLVAVILSAVVLTVALSLLDITYKQVLLASSAKQSQYAFYNADSAMECALYWDQQQGAFSYTASNYLSSGFTCADTSGNVQSIVPMNAPNSTTVSGSTRTTVFYLPCTGGGTSGVVTVSKSDQGATTVFATGYSACNASDPRRIERGLKVTYATSGGSSGSSGSSSTVVVLTSGSSWTIPAGVTSLKVWAVGGGGGGAGSSGIDATSGGGGGAGGVAYKTLSVTGGQSLSYVIGSGGAGGTGASNGSWGGNTTVSYGASFVVGGGGGFGQYNNNTASPLGTYSGGDGGSNGGVGPGISGDHGGTGGGAIGGVDGGGTTQSAGNTGGQSADVSGLQAAVTAASISWTAPGAGSGAGSSATANVNNGATATGFGSGGGGAGYYGGNGGNGLYGGGGGGASGYTGTVSGGTGGQGVVIIQY